MKPEYAQLLKAFTLVLLSISFTVSVFSFNAHDYDYTEDGYDWNDDWDSICKQEFGSDAEVGDWNDLEDAYAEMGSDWTAWLDNEMDWTGSYFLERNGDQYYSSDRAYFGSRHYGSVPSHYMQHDDIDNDEMSLGSWDSTGRQIFCKNPGLEPTAENLDVDIEYTEGDEGYVLGREIVTTFNYDVVDPYEPIDSSLVIDTSGSMSGSRMSDAKSGAKTYVDNTNTAQGDRNAVVDFDSSAYTRQSLTTSKSAAKDSIDAMSAGGGTDHSDALSEGISSLEDGYNPVQVMIVIGDGCGGSASSEASEARSKGIEIHAIMLDDGVCTDDFESFFEDTTCETNQAENEDGDNCWYVTDDQEMILVLESIRERIDEETDINLKMRKKDFAHTQDSYDEYNTLSGGDQEFVRNYYDIDSGNYQDELIWRPTEYSSSGLDLVTGDSSVVLDVEGDNTEYHFDGAVNREVGYVDFSITDFDVERTDSEIEVEVEVTNEGNVDSLERALAVEQSSGSEAYSVVLPSIDAGESQTVNFQVPDGHPVLSPVQVLEIHADPSGYWDSSSHGHGAVLEPNEDNNIVEMGYPPKINDITFTNRTDAHAFEVEADIDMLTDGSDFGECRLELTDEQDNEFPSSGSLQGDLQANGDTSATCIYETVNDSVSDFDVYEEIDVNVTVEDNKGSTMWMERSNTIPNRAPLITLQSPSEGSLELDRDVELDIFIDDPEGDDIQQVEFINDDTDTVIEAVPGPGDGGYSIDWEDLDLGTYEWRVEVTDPYDRRESNTRSFSRVISEIYRVENQVEHEYSSIIVDEGDSSVVFIESSVNTDSREFTTYLEGDNINPEFASNNQDSKTYTVDPDSSIRHQIRLNGTSVGKGELRIITYDETVNLNTTETFPVYVRDSIEEGQPIPGLGTVQVIFALLSSVLIYFLI